LCFCDSFLLYQTMLVIQLASGQFVIEFAASFFCCKSNIQRSDCLSLVRSQAYFVLFKLSIMCYVYVASLNFSYCPDDQYLLCVLVAYYFVFILIVRGKVIRYWYYDLSVLLPVNLIGVPMKWWNDDRWIQTSVYFYL